MANLETILSWFQTGDNPTEEEFRQTFSSFRHNDTKILIKDVDGLESSLNNKLNVDDLPANMAVVDEGETSDVFNKEQIMAMTMMLSDYVKNGKIRADKIEAIGLTDLIEAVEKNIVEFAANSEKYEFQQNDFIAVPINENFSLFMFKGGEKKDKNNYLPTGISNVTIAMVEGLQTVLNGKLDKPLADGSFFTKKTGSSTIHKEINPSANYLLFWDGTDFKSSNIFRESNSLKYGIGTNIPAEQLHLTSRARMLGLVLENNAENLQQQLTYNNKKFYGADDTGIKRRFMFADNEDFIDLANSLTDAQKTAWKTIMNGGFTTNTISVSTVAPKVVKKSNNPIYITVEGANLNLNPLNFNVKLVDKVSEVEIDIPNSQVQLQPGGLSLIFWFNFSTVPIADYYIRINNGIATYTTNESTSVFVRDTVEDINLSDLLWDRICVTQSEIDNTLTTGANTFLFKQNADNSPLVGNNASCVAVAKSSKVLSTGENAVISGTIQIIANIYSFNGLTLGFCDPLLATQLIDATDFSVGLAADGGNWLHLKGIVNKLKVDLSGDPVNIPTNFNLSFTIVKQGNLASINYRFIRYDGVLISGSVKKTITDKNLSLYIIGYSGNIVGSNTILISEAYKF